MRINKGDKVDCKHIPAYGKWYLFNSYKVAKVTADEVLIRDEKNERKNFSRDKSSNYYVGHYFV